MSQSSRGAPGSEPSPSCTVPLFRDGVDVGGAGADVIAVVVEGAGEARGGVVQGLLVDLLKINKMKPRE